MSLFKEILDENQTHNYLGTGRGNINLAPRFVDEDYHIGRDSLLRNAGDPNYVPEEGETDIDGDPRVQEGRVDMGADEFVLQEPSHAALTALN